ncbi:MAG: hypothetical protein ACJAQ6_001841 [Arenicella sp.]
MHISFGRQKASSSQKGFVLMTILKAEKYKDIIFNRIQVKRDHFDSDKESIGFF